MIQLKQNNDIIYQGFTLSGNGLYSIGDPSFKQWEQAGEFIKRSHEAVQFWRGDWLNFGEEHFDQWTQHFDESELSAETLRKEKWVAKRIPLERRRPQLSWSHHEEVADLEAEEQNEMLDLAEKHSLSVHKFRTAVRRFKMHLDAPELSDKDLEPTDPEVFKKVQEVIDASLTAIELLEKLQLDSVHLDARDFLFSHLKRAVGFYLTTVQKYDKQKQIPAEVV
jgi:hypothetical protein